MISVKVLTKEQTQSIQELQEAHRQSVIKTEELYTKLAKTYKSLFGSVKNNCQVEMVLDGEVGVLYSREVYASEQIKTSQNKATE